VSGISGHLSENPDTCLDILDICLGLPDTCLKIRTPPSGPSGHLSRHSGHLPGHSGHLSGPSRHTSGHCEDCRGMSVISGHSPPSPQTLPRHRTIATNLPLSLRYLPADQGLNFIIRLLSSRTLVPVYRATEACHPPDSTSVTSVDDE